MTSFRLLQNTHTKGPPLFTTPTELISSTFFAKKSNSTPRSTTKLYEPLFLSSSETNTTSRRRQNRCSRDVTNALFTPTELISSTFFAKKSNSTPRSTTKLYEPLFLSSSETNTTSRRRQNRCSRDVTNKTRKIESTSVVPFGTRSHEWECLSMKRYPTTVYRSIDG